MTTYKSKIGLELVIPVTIVLAGIGIVMAYNQIWFGLAFILLLGAFIAHMLLTTYYRLDSNKLKIRCGFFFDKTIDVDRIKEIKETNNPVSSPAASLDRLVITYNKYDTVIISPKQKGAFINHLISLNPNIKVSSKNSANQTIPTA